MQTESQTKSNVAPAPQQVVALPRACLVPSPLNPRKAFPPAALQELAASIRAQGIIEPLVVRPVAYELDGRQYIAVAAGGHAIFGYRQGEAIVVFSLPD